MKIKCLFLLFALTFLTGCNDSDKFIIATEAGFKPFEYYENGEIVGVDIEIAKAISDKLGKELVIKDIAFDSIVNEVVTGKSDIGAAGISITDEKKEKVDFSKNYVTSRQVLVVKENSKINNPSDIFDKKIGVQLGTTGDLYLTEKINKKNIVRQKKYLTLVEDLKADKVDAILMDDIPAKSIVKENYGLKILPDELFVDNYGIILKKGNEELLKIINDTIDELIQNGQIDKWVEEHSK